MRSSAVKAMDKGHYTVCCCC